MQVDAPNEPMKDDKVWFETTMHDISGSLGCLIADTIGFVFAACMRNVGPFFSTPYWTLGFVK